MNKNQNFKNKFLIYKKNQKKLMKKIKVYKNKKQTSLVSYLLRIIVYKIYKSS